MSDRPRYPLLWFVPASMLVLGLSLLALGVARLALWVDN